MGYDYEFFRDPPGRYLGYCHVVGRALSGTLVTPFTNMWLTRATLGYIGFDTVYNAMDHRQPNPLLKAADALIWQSLASIVLPKMTVDAVAAVASHFKLKGKLPVALVLLCMPLLGPGIDNGVDFVLDHTTRPILLR